MWETIWQGLNSPVAVAAIAAALTWALGLLWRHRPGWKQYEPSVVAAIRLAEQTIPDDTADRTARILDEALKFVLKVHESAKGRPTKETEEASLTAAVVKKVIELTGEQQT